MTNPQDPKWRHVHTYLEQLPQRKELAEHYAGRSILVTGGAGAIGANLVSALSALVGEDGLIVVLDNLSSIKHPDPWNVPAAGNVLFVQGDIRDETVLKRVFHEDPDTIFHLAAFFANQNSVDYTERSADVDVIGMIRLLEYARTARPHRFVYASSGCSVYGDCKEFPLREDFISMHLTTPYQINKMTGEMYCNFFHHHYGLKIVNCRFFNSYGPGEVPGQYRNVIPNFVYWAMNGLPIPITGTGEETRDFTYVMDLVQGLLLAGCREAAIGQNFNLAAGREIKIRELAEMIVTATGSPSGIQFKSRRKWDTKSRLLASIQKAADLIGYAPRVSFEDGLAANVAWFSDHWERIKALADFPPGLSSAVRK